ncbi:hypothetical protein AVEN_18094-1, partial [Araneus ventricosus]
SLGKEDGPILDHSADTLKGIFARFHDGAEIFIVFHRGVQGPAICRLSKSVSLGLAVAPKNDGAFILCYFTYRLSGHCLAVRGQLEEGNQEKIKGNLYL